ncbi:hypothetical protein BKA03_000252 [Demequina lutea]|uniref:Uncharacterized protein n=1 Tax=Demequina lutea TaxID=431489 RepID=A0A7Y9Z9I7_9MICO|nr:hypothetical protein [Demequina lutea]
MALDQSVPLDLLRELKLGDVGDRIRITTDALYQERIDAGASAFIGAGAFEHTLGERRNATAAAPAPSRPPRGIWRRGQGRSSRHRWTDAAVSTRPYSRS